MISSIRIREFCFPSDYEVVYQLWGSIEKGVHVGRSDAPEEIEKKLTRDPDLFLVAEADGAIIGSVIGGYDGRRGLVYHLAVASEFRDRGIGSRLMDELNHVCGKRLPKCYLLVTEDNPKPRCITSSEAGSTWTPSVCTGRNCSDDPVRDLDPLRPVLTRRTCGLLRTRACESYPVRGLVGGQTRSPSRR
jgi:GNAT superfamily N-acetyltransferase